MKLFRFWPVLGPILALLSGLVHSPQGLAAPGNPYCDLYVQDGLSAADKNDLSRLGYRVVPSSQLRFNLFSLRLHTDRGAWVLDRAPKYDRLYFENPDGLGNTPILDFVLKAKGLPNCVEMKKAVADLAYRRSLVLKAIRLLQGDRSIPLLEALIDLEQLEILKRGRSVKVNYHYLNPLRSAAQSAWRRNANTDFFDRLNSVRRVLLSRSLRSYCRDLTTISELSNKACTNCVGQTALLVSLYADMRIDPPAPWQLGFVLYDDHMQPVLYDAEKNHMIDLVSNRVTLNKSRNPVLAPQEMLRMALRKHRELIWPIDNVEIDRTEYLSSEPMLAFFTANKQAEPDLTARNAHTRIDAFSFQGIRTRSTFTDLPVPETADLGSLINSGYELAEDVRRGGEDALAQKAQKSAAAPANVPQQAGASSFRRPGDYTTGSFSPEVIQHLIPSERSIYAEMARQNYISFEHGQRFAFRQIHSSVQNLNDLVLLPFVIQAEPSLAGWAPFRLWYSNGVLTLELPSNALAEEFRGLPLVQRYQRILELGRQFMLGPIREDLESLAELFSSQDSLMKIVSQSAEWDRRLQRVSLGMQGWGINSVWLWRSVFEPERLSPQARRLDAAARSLAENWGRNPVRFINAASRMSEDQIYSFFRFFARLEVSQVQDFNSDAGDSVEREHLWESLTRPLMLALLYDKQNLWTTIQTVSERNSRATLEASFIKAEDAPSLDIKGPAVDLPKMGHCEPGQRGWITSGSFVWQCPADKKPKQAIVKIGSHSQVVQLRQVRELPPYLLASLLLLNSKLFVHPGHFLLAHEMWTDSLDRAYVELTIRLLSSKSDLSELGREVASVWAAAWRLAPMLLSEKLPVGLLPLNQQQFMAHTMQTRQIPDWVSGHGNYAQAYAYYRANPRPEVGKREIEFIPAKKKAVFGWQTVLVTAPGGADKPYSTGESAAKMAGGQNVYGITSRLNPAFALNTIGKEVHLSLTARFGRQVISAQMVDDGRKISANAFKADLACSEAKTVTLGQGQVYEDSIAVPCADSAK